MKLICPWGAEGGGRNRSFFGGEGTNPSLQIHDFPKETKNLVVIAENSVSHKIKWVVYNIPVTDTIEADFRKGIEAVNEFTRDNSIDPQEGGADTRLTYSVYALDDIISIAGGKGTFSILNAFKNHVLDNAEITIDRGTPLDETRAFFSQANFDLPLGRHD
ncbi:MAG: hypothetical protein JXA18_08155 [Chitinispirillaceae bacterium]|nr:hypothetical protein [Chitinispirillaceae bacterium]